MDASLCRWTRARRVQPTKKTIHNRPCSNQVAHRCEEGFSHPWRRCLRSGVLRSQIGPRRGDQHGAPIWECYGKVRRAFAMRAAEHDDGLPLQWMFVPGDGYI